MGIWLVIFGAGALLLPAGFGLLACGSLRAKNGAGAVLRITADTAISALIFWAIGAAILLGEGNGYFSVDGHLLFQQNAATAEREFFYLTIVLIGGAVVTGALAERARFYVGVGLSAVLAGVLIPVVGHWAWAGWLHDAGFIDVGGATVIHLSAAVCAAVAAAMVGPRMGKYNRDGSSNSIPGHALPLSSVGVLLLLAGWFPYLFGCTVLHDSVHEAALATAAMNLILAAAAGAAAGMMYGQFRYGKPDMFYTYTGLLGAMVAISAGAGTVGNVGAVAIGAVAGIVVPLVTLEIDMLGRLDDPLGVVGIHGAGGIWGTVAAALLSAGTWGQRFKLLGVAGMGIGATIVLCGLTSGVVIGLLRVLGPLRATDADEFDGLDLGEHDINAYPDFQQTTIKSYHLREA